VAWEDQTAAAGCFVVSEGPHVVDQDKVDDRAAKVVDFVAMAVAEEEAGPETVVVRDNIHLVLLAACLEDRLAIVVLADNQGIVTGIQRLVEAHNLVVVGEAASDLAQEDHRIADPSSGFYPAASCWEDSPTKSLFENGREEERRRRYWKRRHLVGCSTSGHNRQVDLHLVVRPDSRPSSLR
jgi:hypothetical protein